MWEVCVIALDSQIFSNYSPKLIRGYSEGTQFVDPKDFEVDPRFLRRLFNCYEIFS